MTSNESARVTAHQAFPGGSPLLSVVLAVGRVEEFLPDCLDSVLSQPDPPGGIEVIAVDDASPDACGRILDERSATDPRLRVIHLADSGGPGPARMHGLAAARGGYVWFADPDDLLTPGSLAAVTGRLHEIKPDLLLLDYRTLLPSGRTEPSPGAGLLDRDCGAITLADQPKLIERTMTLWSKVFARPFLTKLGITMPPGVHEDVPVSACALLRADRIALLPQVCYLYRRRPGSFLATPSMDHFSIFAAYAQIFTLLGTANATGSRDAGGADGPGGADGGGRADSGGEADGGGKADSRSEEYSGGLVAGLRQASGTAGLASPAVRAAVFSRAISHYSSILASGLVPRRARRRFFSEMAADYRRHRPPGCRSPAGLRGLKTALIGHDAYWAYAMLAPVNGARVTARRLLARRGLAERGLDG